LKEKNKKHHYKGIPQGLTDHLVGKKLDIIIKPDKNLFWRKIPPGGKTIGQGAEQGIDQKKKNKKQSRRQEQIEILFAFKYHRCLFYTPLGPAGRSLSTQGDIFGAVQNQTGFSPPQSDPLGLKGSSPPTQGVCKRGTYGT
jgi:hypothetical protein